MLRKLSILTFILCALPIWAQRTSEPDFFDPTRKPDKALEAYKFSCDWRLEIGYAQNNQRSMSDTTYANPFLHGVKIGATVDMNLPYRLSLQTGLALGITYGRLEQHWPTMNPVPMKEYISHGYNQYYLEVPVRLYYTQPLWKELNLFFYTGPKMQIGLAEMDWQNKNQLSDATTAWLNANGVPTTTHNRYQDWTYTNKAGEEITKPRELRRFNIQYGLGGGLEWANYRVVAGYDFGLNNLLYRKPTPKTTMWQWGWYVSFAYKL